MGFSGKPSKGCLPCRQKRTKCDLQVPSCTQCLRKNRICFGYRNEQDMVFRNETGLVIRKVKRKSDTPEEDLPTARDDEDTGALLKVAMGTMKQHPSRMARIQDEAIMHWLANFNETFFSSNHNSIQGFTYILPVCQDDRERGGPVADIVEACGIASLGLSKNSPELLRAARVKQVKVLRQLNEQLQDPKFTLTDSSVLTCLMLSSFENILCEGGQSTAASETHLKGAAALARLRGKFQFDSLIGHGLFVRLRGSILVICLLQGQPLPDFLMQYFGNEGLSESSFEVRFYRCMDRVCTLRAQYKRLGYVTATMAAEAHSIIQHFDEWDPDYPMWNFPDGHRQRRVPRNSSINGLNESPDFITLAESATSFVWVATGWILHMLARILTYEILIVYYRARSTPPSPSSYSSASSLPTSSPPDTNSPLAAAMDSQCALVTDVQLNIEYYYSVLIRSQASTRTLGAYILITPLAVLMSISTATRETHRWIASIAERVTDSFAVRQGVMIREFLKGRVVGDWTRESEKTKEPNEYQ